MSRLKSSVRKFKQFNRKPPRHIRRVAFDTKTPLVRIGEVPEITYISNKEGKRVAYRHVTKKPHPVLYAHPSGKFFVMIGGRVKVKDWLYD